MTNAKIADAFEQVADLLEFQGANPFRVRAYRNLARTIRDLPEPVTAIIDDPARDLTEIPGVGKDLAGKVEQLVHTGRLEMLEELKQQVPESVLDMLRIPGFGPKKAKAVYEQLGVKTLDDLREACLKHQVCQLKGFGEKTEQTILSGLQIAEAANLRILWSDADQIVRELREHMAACDAIQELEMAGSYRRCRETVGDLDMVVVATDGKAVMDRLGQYADVTTLLGRGDTKMSVRLDTGLQIDLRVIPRESFGAALLYFTGSKAHNVELRRRGKGRGLKINEYGVFRVKSGRRIGGEKEDDIYRSLDLPWIPPELREARHEFEWADRGELPELIQLRDLRGDLHMHTLETDGKATIEEMVDAARERGLKYIAITDHSPRVTMANGMDGKRLRAQWKKIDRLNEKLGRSFTLLKGVEVDILEKGGLDLPDSVLAEANWVVASVHYGQSQSRERITRRIVDALANPHVNAIAHPTGRLINRRDPYDVDMEAVFEAARKYGKLLELNANPHRLDLDDVQCAAAKAQGIPIVINSDAHSPEGISVLRYGINQARRGGLAAADVANTRSWAQMKKLIASRMARAAQQAV